jgi:hypothetical protein
MSETMYAVRCPQKTVKGDSVPSQLPGQSLPLDLAMGRASFSTGLEVEPRPATEGDTNELTATNAASAHPLSQ